MQTVNSIKDSANANEPVRRVVAICGATGGIGEALFRAYAEEGVHLLLAGRRKDVLSRLQQEAESLGALAETDAFDIRDRSALEAWALKAAIQGAERLILCSGISASVEPLELSQRRFKDEGCDKCWYLPERMDDLNRELEVNAVGNILAANSFARAVMQLRAENGVFPDEVKPIQIAFIASLAALTGLPGSPGYSASKAALKTYGEALHRLLQKHRVGVTVIFPGYVESDMSRRYIGAKPWLCSAEHAARKIKAAIESGKREFAFPWILAFGIRLLNLLPHWAQGFFLDGFFFTVEPDSESKAQRMSGKRGRDE